MKKLFFFFIGLMIIVGGLYGTLKYMKHEQARVLKTLKENKNADSQAKPLSETDSLKLVVLSFKEDEAKRARKIDSLKTELSVKRRLSKKRKAIDEKLKKELAMAGDKQEKAKVMAKTFEKMKIKQIAPILLNLDDETVMLIYKQTGNRFKRNILLAINEKRAARITKNFINRN